jgi:predicted dinucleotide-binding enzyme
MRIGVIGAGKIGGTLARHFVSVGHEVAVSNSRGPMTLGDVVAKFGPSAHALTAKEASRFGEVVVVSVPFGRHVELAVDDLDNRIVIDTTNYNPTRDGHFNELDSGDITSSELLQSHLSGARVVKAFNAIHWETLRDAGLPHGDPQRIGIPISGDDEDAKRTVAKLIDEIGFDAVDAGALAEGGRKHQPGSRPYGANLPAADLRAHLAG